MKPRIDSTEGLHGEFLAAFGHYRSEIAAIRQKHGTTARRSLKTRLALEDAFGEYRRLLRQVRIHRDGSRVAAG